MDLLCQTFPQIIYNTSGLGITMAFAGASVVFIKEIPMLRIYHLHARIISWSHKWLYVQGVFTLPSSRKPTKKPELPTLPNNLDADFAVPLGTSTPTLTGGSAPGTLLNGEVICAVIYGRYVFKRKSSETVPVSMALENCGYSGDGEIEKKRAEGWEYVKGLEQDWEKDKALLSTEGMLT